MTIQIRSFRQAKKKELRYLATKTVDDSRFLGSIFVPDKYPRQSLSSDLSDGPITMQEYVEVKTALSASETRIQELMKTQNDLNDQLRLMRIKVSTVLHQ